tara:strand:+ start:1760 stop:1981 length:222 start_codon:yes stop_codon:yes gene_type:complete
MNTYFSGLFFVPLSYGMYCMGWLARNSVEIYKGISPSPPPIPISTWFLFTMGGLILLVEIILVFMINRGGEDY